MKPKVANTKITLVVGCDSLSTLEAIAKCVHDKVSGHMRDCVAIFFVHRYCKRIVNIVLVYRQAFLSIIIAQMLMCMHYKLDMK